MDILTHTISGTAAGVVVASFSKGSLAQRAGIILVGTIAGAIPDLDVISKWSGFDGTFGKWFGLTQAGNDIYFDKHWYSHHGALHSFTWALLIPFFFLSLRFAWKRGVRKKQVSYLEWMKKNTIFFVAFTLGMTFHCIEDMITPPLTWGGVAFFWPHPEYIGGWGKIWWWNNYDLFLIVLASIGLNGIILIAAKWFGLKARKLTPFVLLAAIILFTYQINDRPISFGNDGELRGYDSYNDASKSYQKELLHPTVYRWMEGVDEAMPVPF
ncbi:metal-dependent hydrolase [Sanyastnella coralliicola]|uniref:metal-dependent hydrolase n=1 Tax=Sanyastnella coralliicola TaxID=3069118 RepID=UPI0027B91AC5|nr:metal-dependent hydrolase [Longitalea sp. SCSIO 12813]